MENRINALREELKKSIKERLESQPNDIMGLFKEMVMEGKKTQSFEEWLTDLTARNNAKNATRNTPSEETKEDNEIKGSLFDRLKQEQGRIISVTKELKKVFDTLCRDIGRELTPFDIIEIDGFKSVKIYKKFHIQYSNGKIYYMVIADHMPFYFKDINEFKNGSIKTIGLFNVITDDVKSGIIKL